jgi:hypothetical protein
MVTAKPKSRLFIALNVMKVLLPALGHSAKRREYLLKRVLQQSQLCCTSVVCQECCDIHEFGYEANSHTNHYLVIFVSHGVCSSYNAAASVPQLQVELRVSGVVGKDCLDC